MKIKSGLYGIGFRGTGSGGGRSCGTAASGVSILLLAAFGFAKSSQNFITGLSERNFTEKNLESFVKTEE